MAFQESNPSRTKRVYNLPFVTSETSSLLKRKGYRVRVKSQWHLHIRKKGQSTLVNVWPTASKYMVEWDCGATVYKDEEDLLESLKRIFGPPIEDENVLPTPEQEELESYRKDPLAFINRHKIKK